MPIARLSVLFGLFAACFLASAISAEKDDVLRSRLIGTWEEVRDVDTQRHEQRMTLGKDGSFEVKGTMLERGRSTPFIWRGTWEVRKGKFFYKTTFSEPEGVYPVGEFFEDTIVSVSATEWVMIEESTGNQSRARRVR